MKVLLIISTVIISFIVCLFFAILGVILAKEEDNTSKHGAARICLVANILLAFVLVTLILCLARL